MWPQRWAVFLDGRYYECNTRGMMLDFVQAVLLLHHHNEFFVVRIAN